VLEDQVHKRTISKETGGIVVVADQDDSEDQEESSHINLSGRENKSEVEVDHNLSFSDHENRKRRVVTMVSPYIHRTGNDELSRTFEVVEDELGVNFKYIKGKTTVFKSTNKNKNRRVNYPNNLIRVPNADMLGSQNIEKWEDKKIVEVI
jgi:hypothetical protein